MPDLADGESVEMKGSARKPYVLKNIGGVYSCTCPAWRNQSRALEQRTCKHLKKLRGEAAEFERVGGDAPRAPKKTSNTATSAPTKIPPPILLAHKWDNETDPTGWWISEKLDGVRAYWDGSQFISRLGNRYIAPDWFVAGLPEMPLDGELWAGRKMFQKTVSIVRRADAGESWRQISFLIFDAPTHGGRFEQRIDYLKTYFIDQPAPHARVLEHEPCTGIDHLRQQLEHVENLGGEGLMLRQPESAYEVGRSTTLFKVKTFHDAEAKVIGHVAGAGRHKGRLGALRVVTPEGIEFSVGTGLSDKQRESPPDIGRVITYRYQELSDAGVPRFPTYVGERHDFAWPGRDRAAPKEKSKRTSKAGSRAKKTAIEPTVQSPASAATSATLSDSASVRYFEYTDAKSSKFWEIGLTGREHIVRYGRIGSDGTKKLKTFPTDEAARASAEKLIAAKVAKGYVET